MCACVLCLNCVSLQEKMRPLILRYHGRECLFDWMALQVTEAIYHNRNVTPYPEFLQQLVSEGKVSHPCTHTHTLSLSHTHTHS